MTNLSFGQSLLARFSQSPKSSQLPLTVNFASQHDTFTAKTPDGDYTEPHQTPLSPGGGTQSDT